MICKLKARSFIICFSFLFFSCEKEKIINPYPSNMPECFKKQAEEYKGNSSNVELIKKTYLNIEYYAWFFYYDKDDVYIKAPDYTYLNKNCETYCSSIYTLPHQSDSLKILGDSCEKIRDIGQAVIIWKKWND